MKKSLIKKVSILVLLFSILQVQKADTTEIITKNQKEMLEKYDYEVVVVDQIEDTHNWGFNPAGLHSSENKTITLNRSWVKWAWTHEYYHFLDNINNDISQTEEFKNIYDLEKEFFNGENAEYSRTSAIEYFACVGKQYVEEPNKLKESCPQTYNFIKNIGGM